MIAHTEGPWEMEDREERGLIRADAFHDVIAVVQFDLSCSLDADEPEVWDEVEREQRANARLIAAAPELLQALKRAQEFFCSQKRDCICDESVSGKSCPHCEIRSAILKAEGV